VQAAVMHKRRYRMAAYVIEPSSGQRKSWRREIHYVGAVFFDR
jgi:hypothetical protein